MVSSSHSKVCLSNDKLFDICADLITVSHLDPSSGLENAAQTVQVYGSNFVDSWRLRCRFGIYVVVATYVDSTHITCTSPAHLPFQSVAVEVSNNNQQFTFDNIQVMGMI